MCVWSVGHDFFDNDGDGDDDDVVAGPLGKTSTHATTRQGLAKLTHACSVLVSRECTGPDVV